MLQKLFLPFLFVVSFNSFSQDRKFSVELNYPLAVGDNFIAENYHGVIETGFRFYAHTVSPVKMGVSVNGAYLKDSEGDPYNPLYVDLYTIQPRIFGELHIESLSRFHTSVGLGYSFFIFDVLPNDHFGNGGPESKGSIETQKGFNLNLGLSYDLSKRIYVQVQYDFVKLKVENDIPDITYNTNINFIKAGLGYRF